MNKLRETARSNQKLLNSYLKERRFNIGMYLLSVLIFAVVFKLYHISAKVALYPALICSVLWLLFSIINFWQFYNAHQKRVNLSNHIEITLENLPKPTSLLEEDYQNLLRVLMNYNTNQMLEKNQKFSGMEEYITLWSHQMKTPITAIELLLHDLDDIEASKLKEQLFEIERYVDTILQFMRLDTMNSDLLLKEYSLMEIVKQAVKYHTKSFIGKKISLDLQEFETRVVTDEKWLLFVIKQILSNALKYTKEGKISIYVVSEKILVIEDTGIGISPEDTPRIFERGFTGYNGRMDKKSTGIGLYLSKQILDQLNHEMKITSKPGIGTRVEINLTNLTGM